MTHCTRRRFLAQTLAAGGASLALGRLDHATAWAAPKSGKMKLGFCTYLWGQDWDLPTLLANLEKSKILGLETRVEHAHGVEPTLSAAQRSEVKKRFADTPVKFLGPGTNQAFHSPDPAELKKQIEGAKAYIKLSHDLGGSGVKVKPNDLPKSVPQEQTIAQIARALNEIGKFAADYGQEIRVEVHGQCSPPPIMKQIIDQVDQRNVGLCWNSNEQDLEGDGLAANFKLLENRLATTTHIRELNVGDYPYQDLFDLLAASGYAGWLLLECRTKPADRVAALAEQRKLFQKMVQQAQAKA